MTVSMGGVSQEDGSLLLPGSQSGMIPTQRNIKYLQLLYFLECTFIILLLLAKYSLAV